MTYKEYWIGDIFSVRVTNTCPECKKPLIEGKTSIDLDLEITCTGWICPVHGEIKPRTRLHVPKEKDIETT